MKNKKKQYFFILICLFLSVDSLSFFYNHYKKNSINTIQNDLVLNKRISLRTTLSSHCLAPSQSLTIALRHLKKKSSHEPSFQPKSKHQKDEDDPTLKLRVEACWKGNVEKVETLVAQEKKKEQRTDPSFLESLTFLNHFLEDIIPKQKKEGLFVYWAKLMNDKNNIYDTPIDKKLPLFIQELKKYEYHYWQCLRQIFQYGLLQLKQHNSLDKNITIPAYLNFNQNDDSSKSITIRQFIKESFAHLRLRYMLFDISYKDDFDTTTMKLLVSFKKISLLFNQDFSDMRSDIDYWKEALSRFLLVIDQVQKNTDTDSYCHKLFESLNIPMKSKKIKLFSQYEGLLFRHSPLLYPSKSNEVFVVSQDISRLFGLSKKGIKITLNLMNTRHNLDIRYINSRKDFLDLLKTLKEKNPYYLREKYTIGIVLNENHKFRDSPFPEHTVPIILHKKANKEMEIYVFDALARYHFEDLILSKIIKSHHLHESQQTILRTQFGCHLYTISFLVMALQDMKQNNFDPQDIITLNENHLIDHFPFRWADFSQRTLDIKQQYPQQHLNKQVVSMDTNGDLSCVNADLFEKEDKEQKAISIPFFCKEDKKTFAFIKSESLTKELPYRNVLEKKASVFIIKTMIDALNEKISFKASA